MLPRLLHRSLARPSRGASPSFASPATAGSSAVGRPDDAAARPASWAVVGQTTTFFLLSSGPRIPYRAGEKVLLRLLRQHLDVADRIFTLGLYGDFCRQLQCAFQVETPE